MSRVQAKVEKKKPTVKKRKKGQKTLPCTLHAAECSSIEMCPIKYATVMATNATCLNKLQKQVEVVGFTTNSTTANNTPKYYNCH